MTLSSQHYLVITALGADRPGIVNTITRHVSSCGCNIEDSRLAMLGEEFTFIMLLSGSWNAITLIESTLPLKGAELDLLIVMKRTTARPRPPMPASVWVQVDVADSPHLIERFTALFDAHHMNIAELVSRTQPAEKVIRVGAATETEMKEAKLRMEDALNATRAAVEEGIVAGGGSAYIHASKEVAKLVDTLEGDEKTGASVILKALEAPLHQIAANAGLEGAVIINKVRESEVGVGFDAYNEKYVNMVEEGILDPAKVTRSALQNATSVASTFLTTESCVANIKEETPAMPAGGAPGMGGMM